MTERMGRRDEPLQSLVHAEFRAHASYRDIHRLCLEARHYGFAAVLVHPVHCARAAEALAGSAVRLIAAVACPTGAFTIEGKTFEARDSISSGADEIAYVVDVGALRGGKEARVAEEMAALREVTQGHRLTAVVEGTVLTVEQMDRACTLAADAAIEYVAPSTAFRSDSGTMIETVRRLSRTAGGRVGIAAFGEAGTLDEADALLAAGAARIYTGAGAAIAKEFSERAP